MNQENFEEEIVALDEQEIEEAVALETLDEFEIVQAAIEKDELAQTLAMKRGYFDAPIPADIAAPPGLSPKRAELARFWNSENSGEEAAYSLMRSLSKLMDDAVREQGGVVQGFTGDGVMAVFGAPVAFEDAPLRACRAALSILQRLKTTGGDLEAEHGVRPQVRIGLNTGPTVTGSVQSGAEAGVTVLGDTVNVAARFQTLAEPGSICISEATYRLVQGMVEAAFTGEHQIKGKSEPQKVYRLETIRHGAARFDAALSRGLTAYVGRDRELETLEQRLAERASR